MTSVPTAFIDAIRDAPDEDGPRLVCADWFEDQGDAANVARGEFIRIQMFRARLPADDARHSELQARELRLLKRWAPAWCKPHYFRKVRFRRGFIEYVHLHLRHFLHHRRQMLAVEPVRDVSLTGWQRAPADLLRRVAACEEWRHIETLRIHHQGPHKDPRSDLLLLLESPHLARLRSLHGTSVSFDAEARRRFERLPMLRHLKELRFPTLDSWPHHPGEWFSDGGATIAADWQGLRSLTFPYHWSLDFLRQLLGSPFWERLTSLEFLFPWRDGDEALSILRARMPPSLQRLRLFAGSSPSQLSRTDLFLESLAQVPLRSLKVELDPLSPAAMRRLLRGLSGPPLRELSLSGCRLTKEHAQAIAGSPCMRTLQSLDISSNWEFDSSAAQVLFGSADLGSLSHLDLNYTQIGSEGARTLASTKGLGRLRSLNVEGADIDNGGLLALLASPNLQGLTWLGIGGSGHQGNRTLDMNPELAQRIARLPNLAGLHLSVSQCDPASAEILTSSDSLAWPLIECYDDGDVQAYRARRAPESWPPLDEAMERYGRS